MVVRDSSGGVSVGGDVTVRKNRLVNTFKAMTIRSEDTIEDNRITGGSTAIWLFGSGDVIERNVIVGPQIAIFEACSVLCSVPSHESIVRNTVRDAVTGIALGSAGADDVISRNVVVHSGLDGIKVATGDLIVDNRVIDNGLNGIEITSPDDTSFVAGNVADSNAAFGISAGGGPSDVRTDADGNEAHGNGLGQCDPSTLCH